MASPPTINGIFVTLMYKPPTAPVISPGTGPARIPERKIGGCEK